MSANPRWIFTAVLLGSALACASGESDDSEETSTDSTVDETDPDETGSTDDSDDDDTGDSSTSGTPSLRLDPESHDFGSSYVGCDHQDVEVRLVNDGDGAATVAALDWSCEHDLYLTRPTGAGPWSIGPGEELMLTVLWAHWYEGDTRCELEVQWDGAPVVGSYEGRGNAYSMGYDLGKADSAGRLTMDFSRTFGGELLLADADNIESDYWDLDCAIDFDTDRLSCSGMKPGFVHAAYVVRPCLTYGDY